MSTTYIIQSLKDGSYYIGSTDDLDKRISRHNKGYSRYTKSRIPYKIIYQETFKTRSEAKKREYYLKSLKSRAAIENLINGSIV
ncbi:GIY-YIG nuclease family protein [Candidatus Daviesbacteria bacterium]|nr:GIY-YIG nuclease family protein [Candidatus Daviesbacteria bacterium]